jgi:uncharacterized membrane protein YgdD (TMEM256/DUF423 family)
LIIIDFKIIVVNREPVLRNIRTYIIMQKILLLTGSLLGAVAVMLGAFGAHAFKVVLESNQRVETFDTAVKYHFFHTLSLILVAFLIDKYPNKLMEYSGIAMIAGILIFSGSLYILSLTGITKWGAVTPFGGLFLIIGWLLLFAGILKGPTS